MGKTKPAKLRYYLKWAAWVLLVQLVLVNISAAIHAYRFTHFYDGPVPPQKDENLFTRTWKIFTGPKYYRLKEELTPGFPVTTHHIPVDNDDSLQVWYTVKDSSKTCVILLHGMTMNKSYVAEEAAAFQNMGYNTLMVDLRAHGNSTGKKCSLGVSETEDLQKAYEFAQAKNNDHIIIYGISLGAVVALKSVADQKINPDAIIAEMPFNNLHSHFKAKAKLVGFPSQPFAFLVTLWSGVENGFNGFNHSVTRYAKKVNCPVLLQWGEQDMYVSREAINEVFTSLASRNKKFVPYASAGHESLYRAEEWKWQKEVSSFLYQIP